MSDSEGDWHLVDDEGKVVERAAEGSTFMAELVARDNLGDDFVIVEPYTPTFDVVEVQARSMAFFESAARREAEAIDANQGALDDTEAYEEEDEYEEEYEEDEDVGSMGSRDMTDPDDWKLEAILKRQLNKEKEGGLWVYLCKWAGHEEPTWETREVMEDAGWIPQLDAFDDRGKCGNLPGKDSVQNQRALLTHEPRASVLTKRVKCAAALQSFFGSAEQIAARLSVDLECQVMRYCTMNPQLAPPFFHRWSGRKRSHVPTLVYHCTRAENFESIYKSGLLVGGTKNIPIANGHVYGAGVYTASNLRNINYHSYGCNAVIVCIGLVPIECEAENSTVLRVNDYIVFREEEDVYPLWLAQVGGQLESLAEEVTFAEFTSLALRSFNSYPERKYSLYEQRTGVAQGHVVPPTSKKLFSDVKEKPTMYETKVYDKAMQSVRLHTRGHASISKSALKGQPRKVKELVARMAVEERKRQVEKAERPTLAYYPY